MKKILIAIIALFPLLCPAQNVKPLTPEQQLEQAGQNDRDGIFDNAPKQRTMEHIILVFHRASLPLWNFYLLYLLYYSSFY